MKLGRGFWGRDLGGTGDAAGVRFVYDTTKDII